MDSSRVAGLESWRKVHDHGRCGQGVETGGFFSLTALAPSGKVVRIK